MANKLEKLRKFLREIAIHAYLIPTTSAHQGDFGSDADARLAFISGFTGSAGLGIVTLDSAAIWVDSRYYLQADKQVDLTSWNVMKMGKMQVPTKAEWLKSVFKADHAKVGFDPMLMSLSEITDLKNALKDTNVELSGVDANLIDNVWQDKPQRKLNPIVPHPLEYSGRKVVDKVKAVREQLEELNADAVFVTALDDVAWLFNLRGTDCDMTPVFYSYALVSRNELHLYLHKERKLSSSVMEHFKKEGISDMIKVEDYASVIKGFADFVSTSSGKIVLPSVVNYAVASTVPCERKITKNLVGLMKAIKNDVEAEGMKRCHVRDGAAIVRYFHWLEQNIDHQKISEYEGALQLEEFRSVLDKFKSLSFPTISSVGPNAAINHYVPGKECAQITKNEIYLLDSGGQYLDGTTDTTRTIHLGTPSAFEKEAFTRVLKGFMAVYTAIFPVGVTEAYFDSMARKYLWDIGLDYGHKTGHGVGSYLAVHEFPPLLGPKPDAMHPGLQKNMFTSNEPGCYIDGKFGIRIEDVVQIVPVNCQFDYHGKGMLKFDIVTMVPFQRKLIDVNLLTDDEITWINAYHAKCFKEVGGHLLQQGLTDVHQWLKHATEPISK